MSVVLLATREPVRSRPPIAMPLPLRPEAGSSDAIDMRQLRHQTRNAMQRLICEIARVTELQTTLMGRSLLDDLQRRICLSASLSDALFGLTRTPGSLADRLRHLGEGLIGLLGSGDQVISLTVEAAVTCDDRAQEALLRVAHEMVGNAVKHGMHQRLTGRIAVRVIGDARSLRLTVRDDGWGPPMQAGAGEGTAIMRALAAAAGGTVSLRRDGDATLATLDLPVPARGREVSDA